MGPLPLVAAHLEIGEESPAASCLGLQAAKPGQRRADGGASWEALDSLGKHPSQVRPGDVHVQKQGYVHAGEGLCLSDTAHISQAWETDVGNRTPVNVLH